MVQKGNLSLCKSNSRMKLMVFCASTFLLAPTLISGCNSTDLESNYLFDGVKEATVNENIYTITMNDGDTFTISREDLDSTYDYSYDPNIYEGWQPRILQDNHGEALDDIFNVTSDEEFQNAQEDDDVVLVKRIQ